MANLQFDGVVSAVVVSAAALLALAAVAKLRSPGATRELLARLSVPARPGAVLAIALVELASAGAALFGGVATVPLAGCYAVFTAVGLRLLVTQPGASCGCFGGGADTPITPLHPIVTAVFAAAAIAAVWAPPGWAAVGTHGLTGAVLAGQSLLLAALAYAALAVYPLLVQARRKVAS